MEMSSAAVNAGLDARRPDYQALKTRLHQELLGVLDLNRLAHIKREDAEPEIRSVLAGIVAGIVNPYRK